MTEKLLIILLGIFTILPAITLSAYAQDTWTVSINPYEEQGGKELFQPRELPIKSGDKVIWKNNDSTMHKIVSGMPKHLDYSGEYFSSENIDRGKDYSIILESRGFAGYYYFCEIHPWYTGKVFFEDNPHVIESITDISYEIKDSKMLEVKGTVEDDYRNTEYEMLIFTSKNNLIFQQVGSFNHDSTFNKLIDISSSVWEQEEDYVLKLVFGVPSESTTIPLKIHNSINYQSGTLELCQISESNSEFILDGINLPNWYQKPLCWLDKGWITETEVAYSLDFFRNSLQK